MQALMNGSFAVQPTWVGVIQEYGFTVTGSSEFLREARNLYFFYKVTIKNNFLNCMDQHFLEQSAFVDLEFTIADSVFYSNVQNGGPKVRFQ